MGLGHDGEAARGQALDVVEALDYVHLPKGLAEIEVARVQARHLDAELAPVPRLWQGNVADVVLKVEVRVFDPVGMVEAEGDLHQLLAERAGDVEPVTD